MEKRYFFTEEYRVGQKNVFIPLYIVGYGKSTIDEMLDIIYAVKNSPLADITLKGFKTNKQYHQYLREMQKRGTRISFNGRIKKK